MSSLIQLSHQIGVVRISDTGASFGVIDVGVIRGPETKL
jgi:hypothetical protein